jgi:hypothetical protein
MFREKSRKRQLQVGLLPLVLLIFMWSIVACGDNGQGNVTSKPSLPRITTVAKDFSFDIPETLPAGLVAITMNNVGTKPHQAILARLNQGVTSDQVLRAAVKSPSEALALLTSVGGPGTIDSNQSTEVILNLSPGQYVVICFVFGQDHIYHTTKGMIKFFQVTEPSNLGQVSQPVAQGKVIFKDYSFVLPDSLKAAGPILLNVTNEGAEPHQITFLKLAPGKTVLDAINYFDKQAGPAPFERAGGMSTLSTGQSAWAKLDLKPGNYAALCFVPGRATKLPHFKMGMVGSFTVQ